MKRQGGERYEGKRGEVEEEKRDREKAKLLLTTIGRLRCDQKTFR